MSTAGSRSSRCRSTARNWLPRRRDGNPWLNGIAEKWRAWASMPHGRLWREPIGNTHAMPSSLAAAFADGANFSLWVELRLRQKQLGSTDADALQIAAAAGTDRRSADHRRRGQDA